MTRLVLVLMLGLSLAACGKKGPLAPPPGYDRPAPAQTE